MKVLDIFCGAGGFSLGFEKSGYDIVGGIDSESSAIDTFQMNFNDALCICGDICEVGDEFVVEHFGDVDVVIGGPPCQGFSVANLHGDDIEKDTRNKLFYEFIRFVKLIKPRAFVMENVPRILTKDNGKVKNVMLSVMDDLGYNVNIEILTASDYGVPQKRKRAFFVGIRRDFKKIYNFNELKKIAQTTVDEAISDLYYMDKEYGHSTVDDIFTLTSVPDYLYQTIMREHSNNLLYNHNIRYPNEKVQERISYVEEGNNWKQVPEELWDTVRSNRHSSVYRRLDSKKPSITIDTGHMNYFHPKFNRVPTVRESARIQSFPDDFIFYGSQTKQFMLVGNAVPPMLSSTIASSLMFYITDTFI